MSEVVIRHVYSAFAAAFVAYSGHSVALLLQPIRDVHDIWKFQATLCQWSCV